MCRLIQNNILLTELSTFGKENMNPSLVPHCKVTTHLGEEGKKPKDEHHKRMRTV
jgi:hypothetical protein